MQISGRMRSYVLQSQISELFDPLDLQELINQNARYLKINGTFSSKQNNNISI